MEKIPHKNFVLVGTILTSLPPMLTLIFSSPTILAPGALLSIVPWIFSYGIWFFLPSFCFLITNLRARKDHKKILLAMLSIIILLSITFFIEFWDYWIAYQGLFYILSLVSINTLFLWIAWVIIRRYIKTWNIFYAQIAHMLLFMFLWWFAFPYLGET